MDPNHPKIAEISYELKIHNLDPSGTAEAKWKILQGVLSQENANRSFQKTHVNPYDHTDDVVYNIVLSSSSKQQEMTYKM